jgi:hypothetical protein
VGVTVFDILLAHVDWVLEVNVVVFKPSSDVLE